MASPGVCRDAATGWDKPIDLDPEWVADCKTRPFVTGKAIKLRLEMLVVERNRSDHRIFAAVSPKPAESPVWKLLRKLKQEFQEHATRSGK